MLYIFLNTAPLTIIDTSRPFRIYVALISRRRTHKHISLLSQNHTVAMDCNPPSTLMFFSLCFFSLCFFTYVFFTYVFLRMFFTYVFTRDLLLDENLLSLTMYNLAIDITIHSFNTVTSPTTSSFYKYFFTTSSLPNHSFYNHAVYNRRLQPFFYHTFIINTIHILRSGFHTNAPYCFKCVL